MAKELVICVAYLMLLAVTIASSEIKTSDLCETQSKTWTGDCNSSYMCDRRCRRWEGEQHGVCHLYEAKNICFCYSDCSKKSSPPKKLSASKKLCETQSKTWFGDCKDSNKCDKQCIKWEGEEHGACHLHEAKHLCFCYSDCNSKGKKPPPPPQKSSPPPGVGKPPPSGSGQPTPPEGTQPAPPEGGQPTPPKGTQPTPPEGGQPTPPGGSEPSPPDAGHPAPPDGGIPTPPPGCQTVDVDKLIAEALNRYKAQLIEKAPHLEHLIKPVHHP